MASGDEYFEDLLKIEMLWTGERNTAANVMYASCLAAHGADASTLNTLADDIGSKFAEELSDYWHENYTLETCTVADWTDASGLTGSHLLGQAGALTGAQLPDQVATLINFESLLRYRGGRGRLYLPGPDATHLETGTTWTGAFVTDVTTAIVAFIDYVNTLEIGDDLLTFVLYHRAGSKVVTQGFEEVVGASCSITPGTQRRRVRRVGHMA